MLAPSLTPFSRASDTEAETVELARRVERCGVAALAVHGRYVSQRPRDPAHWEQIATVVAAVASIPVIANGDVFTHADFARCRAATGAAAAMAARGAQWDASVFRAAGPAPGREVRERYVAACVAWDNPLSNSKYCLREMLLVAPGGLRSAEAVTLHEAKTQDALAQAYGLRACDAQALRQQAASAEAARRERAHADGARPEGGAPALKRSREEGDGEADDDDAES
jgi:tRNA-dihydrouridine synthase 2